MTGATYCVLVGLQGAERLRVLETLAVPELSQARARIGPSDRLVIVARDVAAEARGVVASSWRRQGRTVDVIPAEYASGWRAARDAAPVRRPAPAPAPPPPAPAPPTNYEHVGARWAKRVRPRKERLPCAFCCDPVTGSQPMAVGNLWAHVSCLTRARKDVAMLQAAPVRPADKLERLRARRLATAGLMVRREDGMYYRADAHDGG